MTQLGNPQIVSRNYSDDEISYMQQLSNEGYTATEIAAMFLEKFKRLVTRNAVIGLWTRERVKRDPANKRVVIDKPLVKFDFKDRKTKREKLPDPLAKARAERARAVRILKMSEHWKPLEGIDPVSLIDRQNFQCRWPVDQFDSYGIHMSCGAPREAESSFCPTHSHIAFAPARQR